MYICKCNQIYIHNVCLHHSLTFNQASKDISPSKSSSEKDDGTLPDTTAVSENKLMSLAVAWGVALLISWRC